MRDRNAFGFSLSCRLAGLESGPSQCAAHAQALLLHELRQRLHSQEQPLQPPEVSVRQVATFPVPLLRLQDEARLERPDPRQETSSQSTRLRHRHHE